MWGVTVAMTILPKVTWDHLLTFTSMVNFRHWAALAVEEEKEQDVGRDGGSDISATVTVMPPRLARALRRSWRSFWH